MQLFQQGEKINKVSRENIIDISNDIKFRLKLKRVPINNIDQYLFEPSMISKQ